LLDKYPLQLIVDLTEANMVTENNPFIPYSKLDFHGQDMARQYIYAHPKRNLAVIVETAVKNYILDQSGNKAGQLLIQRQQQYL